MTSAPEQPSAEGGQPAEEPAGGATPGDDGAQVAGELEELVADLRSERDQYLDLAQRAKADFDNYRRRAAREAAEAESRGKAAIARVLLPSIDDLERALVAVDAGSEVGRGIALVHEALRSGLERAGVEAYDPTGEGFDPKLHEAVSVRPAGDGAEPGTVVETLERGYALDGQVIRPARVIVGE